MAALAGLAGTSRGGGPRPAGWSAPWWWACLAFVPWVPTFIYQSRYTGTPWAKPPNFAAIINAVTGFTDNQATLSTAGSNQGRLLALCYFVLAALALFGVARDRWHIDLDLRTRFPARGVAFVVVVTLEAAITGGIVTGSAFSPAMPRWSSSRCWCWWPSGPCTLADAKLRLAVVAVVAVAGLAGGVENIWTERTQAPAVANVLAAQARPGDIVAFCPDQLGPGRVPAGRVGPDRPDRVRPGASA